MVVVVPALVEDARLAQRIATIQRIHLGKQKKRQKPSDKAAHIARVDEDSRAVGVELRIALAENAVVVELLAQIEHARRCASDVHPLFVCE